jgi:hypothetical protein
LKLLEKVSSKVIFMGTVIKNSFNKYTIIGGPKFIIEKANELYQEYEQNHTGEFICIVY